MSENNKTLYVALAAVVIVALGVALILTSSGAGTTPERLGGLVHNVKEIFADGLELGTTGGGRALDIDVSSASTNASSSVEPVRMVSTMTGTGGVGGRALFKMDTEVVLGGWANALKGYTDFGTAGSVTGLGSAVLAELRLPAKTLTGGNYAPMEIELVTQASGTTGGTPVSFIHAQVSGDSTANTDYQTTGYVMSLQGLGSASSSSILQANTDQPTHALRILIGSTPYYLLMTSVDNGTE